MTAADLEPIAEAPAAVLVELPQRDIGGWLPTWHDLEAQVAWAHGKGAAAHLDGARLWEAAAGYERTPAEVADLFDTVYVSFYKGIGAIGGCCVAGPADVVAEVREWRTRHGGTIFGLWPYAASCLASLRTRGPRMTDYLRHAMAIGEALRSVSGAQVVPEAALRLARDRQIWTFVRWSRADTPGVQIVELPVGDATLAFTPEEISEIFRFLLTDAG
jgi:threonine aldolase